MEENAMQNKVVIPNKVQKVGTGNRKFKIMKDKGNEVDADVEIVDDPKDKDITFEVVKLSVDGLPPTMQPTVFCHNPWFGFLGGGDFRW
jgi:hypothetical protein